MRLDYLKEQFNAGQEVQWSSRYLEPDEYAEQNDLMDVDFLKIDTDGHDFPVLLGASDLLRSGGVLGVELELQFHGACHGFSNTFSNIDRFLRDLGFTLFVLEPYTYTKGALPGGFLHDIPAQTHSGQVQWAEGVDFRDLADLDYDRMVPYAVTEPKILKLAALFELFALDVCAVELLQNRAPGRAYATHLAALLDALTPSLRGKSVSYSDYLAYFDQDPSRFLASSFPTENANRPYGTSVRVLRKLAGIARLLRRRLSRLVRGAEARLRG